jgi:mono/diheme cytochrome c family protein
MIQRNHILVGIVILSSVAVAQQPESQDATQVAIPGRVLFVANCAACHGLDGRGVNSATSSKNPSSPDLTQVTKRNGGQFPAMRVTAAIDGEYDQPLNSVRAMPVWGPVFRSRAHGHADSAQVQILKLVRYVRSLQEQ